MILRLYVHIRVCITVQRNRILSELTWHFTSFASIRVPLSFVPVSLKLERDFHSRSLPNEGIFQGTERSRERSLHSVFFFSFLLFLFLFQRVAAASASRIRTSKRPVAQVAAAGLAVVWPLYPTGHLSSSISYRLITMSLLVLVRIVANTSSSYRLCHTSSASTLRPLGSS